MILVVEILGVDLPNEILEVLKKHKVDFEDYDDYDHYNHATDEIDELVKEVEIRDNYISKITKESHNWENLFNEVLYEFHKFKVDHNFIDCFGNSIEKK